jgi:hypothetical protein
MNWHEAPGVASKAGSSFLTGLSFPHREQNRFGKSNSRLPGRSFNREAL